jgi:hypothetical protein
MGLAGTTWQPFSRALSALLDPPRKARTLGAEERPRVLGAEGDLAVLGGDGGERAPIEACFGCAA